MDQAERFLRAARYLLRDTRRWELDYLAAEFECRLLEARGALDQALAVRQQSVAALERARLPSIELLHHLAIAQMYFDRGTPALADLPLDRALRLVDNLHLFPPSPGLLRAWLLDGRRYALAGSVDAARDRWSALTDLPPLLSLPRIRGEAFLRLALLEQAVGRPDEAARLVTALEGPELAGALPPHWRAWVTEVPSRAAASEHGGGALPRPPPPAAPPKSPRAERRRR
jgi:ATP/maltotriose-dependent transcriptional regulator MalT